VSLEWQLNDTKPVLEKYRVSVLREIAERAKEVIPVQHFSVVIYALPLVELAHLL